MIGAFKKIRGKLMGIAIGDKMIACETDSSMTFERDMLPVASVEDGRWSQSLPGKRRWTMTVDGHLLKRDVGADFKTLFRAFVNDEEIRVSWRTRQGVDQFLMFEGKAFIVSGMGSAPNKGYATWNIVFQGNGALNMDWEEFFTILNAMPATADQPNIVDTREWD